VITRNTNIKWSKKIPFAVLKYSHSIDNEMWEMIPAWIEAYIERVNGTNLILPLPLGLSGEVPFTYTSEDEYSWVDAKDMPKTPWEEAASPMLVIKRTKSLQVHNNPDPDPDDNIATYHRLLTIQEWAEFRDK